MANFFQNADAYTEFFVPQTNEVWVFGDRPENITAATPHIFVTRNPSWGDGTELEMELPITDGHGTREMAIGKVYVGSPSELVGTTAGANVVSFWVFNHNTAA